MHSRPREPIPQALDAGPARSAPVARPNDPDAVAARAAAAAERRAAQAQHEAQRGSAQALLLRKQLEEYEAHRRAHGRVHDWDGKTVLGTVVAAAPQALVVHAGRHHYVRIEHEPAPEMTVGSFVQFDGAGGRLVEREAEQRDRARGPRERGE